MDWLTTAVSIAGAGISAWSVMSANNRRKRNEWYGLEQKVALNEQRLVDLERRVVEKLQNFKDETAQVHVMDTRLAVVIDRMRVLEQMLLLTPKGIRDG